MLRYVYYDGCGWTEYLLYVKTFYQRLWHIMKVWQFKTALASYGLVLTGLLWIFTHSDRFSDARICYDESLANLYCRHRTRSATQSGEPLAGMLLPMNMYSNLVCMLYVTPDTMPFAYALWTMTGEGCGRRGKCNERGRKRYISQGIHPRAMSCVKRETRSRTKASGITCKR